MTTYAEILSLIASAPTTSIDLADNTLSLSVAEAEGLVAAGIVLAADDVVTIVDAASAIEALDTAGMATLVGFGAAALVATDRQLALDLDQIHAAAAADLAVFSRYSTYATTSATATTVNTRTAGEQDGQAVTALADGGYVITWQSFRNDGSDLGIAAQRFDANGTPVSGEVIVNTYTNATQSAAQVVSLANGGYVVVWQSLFQGSSIYSFHAQSFDADGNKLGGETPVSTANETYQANPAITALAGGGYVVTWLVSSDYTDWTAMAQTFDASGNKVGGEVSLGEAYLYSEPPATITALANGKCVVAWASTDASGNIDLHLQILGPDGGKIGDVVTANTYTADTQQDQQICALPGGGFVLGWVSVGQDGSNGGVYAQLFNAAGQPIGSETRANAYTAGWQSGLTVTALASGGYVITWISAGQDGSSDGIYAQVFGADGTKVATEVAINTTTDGDQSAQDVTSLPGGGYAVTWISVTSSGRDVCLQIFDANGQKVGSEIHAATSTGTALPEIVTLASGDIVVTWNGSDGDHEGVFSMRFTADTAKASFTATASSVSALAAADIADLVELGVTLIRVSDDGDVMLPEAIALELSAISGLAIDSSADIIVTGTGAALDDLSATQIGALNAIGVTMLDVTDNAITLAYAQADAMATRAMSFAAGDHIIVRMTASQFAALEVTTIGAIGIAALHSMGADVIDLTDGAATLTLARASAVGNAGLAFAAEDTITVSDTATAVSALTAADITLLGTVGVSRIDLTDNAITLTVEAITRFIDAGIGFAGNDTVTLSDTAAHIATLTASGIASLHAAGVDAVAATGGDLTLTLAQLGALGDNGITLTAAGHTIAAADTGAAFAAFSTAEIAYLQNFGVTSVDATDDKASLTSSQAHAFATAGIAFASGDVVTVLLTAADAAALDSGDLAAFTGIGADRIGSTETSLDFSQSHLTAILSSGLTFDSGFEAILADTATVLLATSTTALAAYTGIGVDALALADSGANIAALSVSTISALSRLGVVTADITDGAVSLTMARAMQFAANGIAFNTADTVAVTATSTSLADPDTIDIGALQSIHVDTIDVSDGAMTMSQSLATTYAASGMHFAAANAITVSLTLAEASALTAQTAATLHAAGVDVVEIAATPDEIKALTVTQIAALGAAGIDAIDLEPDTLVLSAAQFAAFGQAGIDFAADDVVSAHKAPSLVSDTASANENVVVRVNVLANDSAFDDMSLSLHAASVTAGKGAVAVNADGSLSVRYTGADMSAQQTASVTVSYSATDGELSSTANLVVTFHGVKPADINGTARADKLTGTAAGELIKGLGGNDTIKGLGGADTIDGGAGNDTIHGGSGNDTMIGGKGHDTLTGGTGADTFEFLTGDSSKARASADTITDFTRTDSLDLTGWDANSKRGGVQDFDFIGTAAFSKHAGEIRYVTEKADTWIQGDTNGDGKADFLIHLDGALQLKAGQFDL